VAAAIIGSSRSVAVSAVVVALTACHPAPPRGPALATIDPAAQALLDAWADAAGGRDALARITHTHVRAHVHRGGLDGVVETWSDSTGRVREDLVLGGFLRDTTIFDGVHGWDVDRNGWVRALAGVELEDELAQAFTDTGAALLPERRAGTVRATPSGELVLAAAGSRATTTIELDPATHLPRAYLRQRGDKHYRLELSDWRDSRGVRTAFASRSTSDDPNDAATVTVDSIDDAPPPPHAFERPPARASDAVFDAAARDGVVELPIDVTTGGIVMVSATVNGHKLDFILDSGSEGSALNAARLAALGLASAGTFAAGAPGGDTLISYVQHVTFELPGVSVRDQTVATLHFEQVEPMFGRPIDGILGYDFLSRFAVELDYPRARLRLHDPARFTHDAARAIPITLEGSLPWTDATIEVPGRAPLAGHFILDTGCTCQITFTSPFTDSNHLLDSVHAAALGSFAGAGGETRAVTGEIGALTIGPTTIERPSAEFSRDEHGATADPDSAGLIGAQTFRRFVLVLDYAGSRVWLDPAS
jgi:hypothetical protein